VGLLTANSCRDAPPPGLIGPDAAAVAILRRALIAMETWRSLPQR